jgi:hypothetical protein
MASRHHATLCPVREEAWLWSGKRLKGFFRFQWYIGQESDVAAAMLSDRGPFRMADGDPEAMTLPSATKAI